MAALRHVAVVTAMTVAFGATSALGAVRYAAPAGTGLDPCLESNPCALGSAITGAAAGDEVRVLPGTYTRSTLIEVFASGVTIVGTSRTNPPKINASSRFLEADASITLRDLDIAAAPIFGASVDAEDLTAERVRIRAITAGGGTYQALVARRLDLRDSVVVTDLGGGVAVGVKDGSITGSTIVGNAGSGTRAISMDLEYWSAPSGNLTVRNTIAEGVTDDLELNANVGQTATIDIDYSNYQTVLTRGPGTETVNAGTHNVTAPAQLLDLPGRTDLHQATGSPTVDAGDPSLVRAGDFDLDGQGRFTGSAPDMGADELLDAPSAAWNPVSGLTTTSATLNGRVQPSGWVATAWFEYGPTTAYGTRTPDVAFAAGALPQNISTSVGGLVAGTTYHGRIVVESSFGRVNGPDQTFQTVAAAPATDPAPLLGKIALAASKVRTGQRVAMRFPLSERAGLTVTIYRRVPGRLVGTTCKVTARVGKACLKPIKRTTLRLTQTAGAPTLYRLPARPGGTALAPGLYEVRIVAKDLVNGALSRTRIARFTVTR